jgi:hypothetical protein
MKKKKNPKDKILRIITPDKIYEGGDKYYTKNENGEVEHLYTDKKDSWRRGSLDESIKEIFKDKNG